MSNASLADRTVEGRAGTVALFDLDRTLLPGSSLAYLARVLLRNHELPLSAAARALVQEFAFGRWGASDHTVERLQRRLLSLASGRSHADLSAMAIQAATAAVRDVFPEARRLVEQHSNAGARVVIVSASPYELVAPLATAIGAIGVGTRVEVIDGRLTGRISGAFCYGAGKLERLAHDVPLTTWEGVTAYSDSASDLPMLNACATPIAINPDRRLRAVAEQRGWPVVRFAR